jgi:phosphoglycolate phosphatase-like HAD superfamily hydrolase
VIRELSRSASLVMITGNSCAVVNKFLGSYGLSNEFQMILAAEDDGSRVEKIHKAISHNSSLNGEVYIIGDAASDIRAAHETGIKSIAVGWGHQSKEKLLKESPDLLVEQPEELLILFTD